MVSGRSSRPPAARTPPMQKSMMPLEPASIKMLSKIGVRMVERDPMADMMPKLRPLTLEGKISLM